MYKPGERPDHLVKLQTKDDLTPENATAHVQLTDSKEAEKVNGPANATAVV